MDMGHEKKLIMSQKVRPAKISDFSLLNQKPNFQAPVFLVGRVVFSVRNLER